MLYNATGGGVELNEICSGWWVVEQEDAGIKVRSVASVNEQGRVKHEDFAFEHSVEDMKEDYGFKFIKLINLWEVA